ncbi:hypothetical protein ACFQ1S_34425, partial [Kibdelosporangium lantanae]
ILVLVRRFSEKVERQHRKIDYTGSALLTIGLSLVLLGLLEGHVAGLVAYDEGDVVPRRSE